MELLRDTVLDLAEGAWVLLRFVLCVAVVVAAIVAFAVFVASL